jgi:hypothetical protein
MASAGALRAIESEVWISPNGPVASMETNSYPADTIGTPTYPFRCPDGGSLNWVLQNDLTNEHMTIHLMAGTFEIKPTREPTWGWSIGIKALTGWKLRGAGIDNTILQMAGPAATNTQTSVVGGPFTANADGAEVSDLTIDCNLQNNRDADNLNAVELFGSDAKISRVKAVNWGTTTKHEDFVLVICPQNAFTFYATNCVIEECVVTQPAQVLPGSGGVTAISIFTEGNYSSCDVAGAVVRDNLVYNVRTGASVGAVWNFNAYCQGGIVRHNQALNLTGRTAAAVYHDSGSTRDGVVEDNVFDNVTMGIRFNFDSGGVTNQVFRNNIIRTTEGGTGIWYGYTPSNTPTKNLVVKDNIVYPSINATNATALNLQSHMTATVTGNIFQGGGIGNDVSIPYDYSPNGANSNPPVRFSTWAGNVNFSGSEFKEGEDLAWEPGDEDSITFTPASPGWYRVLCGATFNAAAVKITSGFWDNATTDTEFWFRLQAYGTTTNTLGELVETRRGSYSYPWAGQITQVRMGSDMLPDNRVYLDFYVRTNSAFPIKVTMSGPGRGKMLNPPAPGASAPALSAVWPLP